MKHVFFIKAYLVIIFGAILLMTSCSPVYYGPTAPTISGLEKKGDIRVSGGISVSENGEHSNPIQNTQSSQNRSRSSNSSNTSVGGLDFSLAYSPIDRLGLTYNLSAFSEEGSTYSGNYTLHNFGVGYYKVLAPSVIWESYATLGLGKLNISAQEDGTLSSNLFKTGIQSGLLWRNSIVEFGGTLSLAHLRYTGIKGDFLYEENSQSAYLQNNRSHILLEPSMVMRVGYKPVKFQLMMTASENLFNRGYRQNNFHFSFGAQLAFNFINEELD
jgi:hypothetical protein